ncbi:hypothetical protein RND71_022911 [Anisodus tanguticus]|uniref:Uncharacterized protein n=1 Tax=Anisodus tanguticus TaxID=243964 RepID=A0AAE1RSZ1_9SOLA|nr:hypothetical protein RND71_022911 [Anisodus tanguticus]
MDSRRSLSVDVHATSVNSREESEASLKRRMTEIDERIALVKAKLKEIDHLLNLSKEVRGMMEDYVPQSGSPAPSRIMKVEFESQPLKEATSATSDAAPKSDEVPLTPKLDEKTEAMLRMYYKKQPQLYRTHRLLAEKYDQIKSVRICYSETFDSETELSDNMSEVDDPDFKKEEIQTPRAEKETMEVSTSFRFNNDEVLKLREEIERLKEENKVQQELLVQKDEEKREVIRQLSLAVDMLREENIMLRKSVTTKASAP